MKLVISASYAVLAAVLIAPCVAVAQDLPTAQPNPSDSPARESDSATPPAAARSAEQGGATLDEVVVTATRREERLQDVPVAVSAMTGETLNEQQVTNVASLQRVTPNLRILGVGGDPSNASIGIRGQISTDASVTIDPAVGVYINGVYLGRATGGNLDMLDLARVETLRGPQGTLFGRNTIGGAINLVPNEPTSEFGGSISTSVGNFKQWNVTGILNVPINDRVQVRGVVNHAERGGVAESSITGRELGDYEKTFLRFSASLDVTDNVNVLVSADKFTFHSGGNWQTFVGFIPGNATLRGFFGSDADAEAALAPHVDPYDRTPASETRGDIDAESRGVSAIVTADFGSATFKSISAYRDVWRFGDDDDSDGTPYILISEHGYLSEQKQFSQEVQLFGKAFDERLDWIVGGYFFDEKATTATGTDTLNGIARTGIYSLTQANAKARSAAVYTQLTYSIFENLRATAGVRYTSDTRDTISTNRNVRAENPIRNFLDDPTATCNTTGPAPSCVLRPPTASFHYLPFTVGLDWKPMDETLLYAKFSRGFRAGGFNTRPSALGNVQAFGPEQVDSYEAGVKSDLFDGHLRVNAAVFLSKFSEIQIVGQGQIVNPATGTPISSSLAVNAGEATIQGLELESTLVFGELKLGAVLSLLDAQFDEVDPNVARTVVKESTFRGAPKYQYSLSADYSFYLPLGELKLHGDWNYVDRQYFAPIPPSTPLNQERGYGLLNGVATLAMGDTPVEISVWGRNLLDEEYLKFTIDTTSFGYVHGHPGDPRMYGVTLNYRF